MIYATDILFAKLHLTFILSKKKINPQRNEFYLIFIHFVNNADKKKNDTDQIKLNIM